MKKVLAALVLILIASTVSAAEVKIGAWGRGLFVPYYSDGDNDAQTMDAVSWGAGNPRVGVNLIGNSDNAGFQIDLNGDGNSINAGDEQKIWIKPMDMLKVSVGCAYDDTLRGNGTFGSWDWLRPSGINGEDVTFMRVRTDMNSAMGRQGAIIALDPMKELHAYVSFNSLSSTTLMEDAMKNIQVGAGYTIGTLGQIRAQYVGLFTPEVVEDPEAGIVGADEVDASYINAAFKLTMVQNLYADFGVFFPTDSDGAGYDMRFAAYVKYTMGAIGIHGLANVTLNKKYDELEPADPANPGTEEEMAMEFGVGLDYALGNGLGVVLDFRYFNEAHVEVKDGNIAALVGIEKGFSNGKIGAGVQFATAQIFGEPMVAADDAKAQEELTIAIPVKVEYWF